MKYRNFRKLNESIGDDWDMPTDDELAELGQKDKEHDEIMTQRELEAERKASGGLGDEDYVPIEFGGIENTDDEYYNPNEEGDEDYDLPAHKKIKDEGPIDLDDLDGPSASEIEDFPYEPTSNFNEPIEYGASSDLEAELRDLQAELRELPKGDPRKKELASQILSIHKQLSDGDEDYTSRHQSRLDKMGKAEVKRQAWVDSMMDSPEDTYESARVLRCSEWMLLEKKRTEVLKDANKKYPNLSKAEMQKMLKDQKAGAKDFKTKAKKYFGWAKDPEAAAAAFIRKATGKEPKDI